MTFGRIAYEAYVNDTGGKFAAWYLLDPLVKNAWEVAAQAVMVEFVKETQIPRHR